MAKKKYKAGDQIQLDPEIDALILMEMDILTGGNLVMRQAFFALGEARRRMWDEVHRKYPELLEWECSIDQVFQRLTVVRKRD